MTRTRYTATDFRTGAFITSFESADEDYAEARLDLLRHDWPAMVVRTSESASDGVSS